MIIAGNTAFGQLSTQFKDEIRVSVKLFSSVKPDFTTTPLRLLPENFYCTQLGFFCKKEIMFEKITRVPFKFRLGSIQYNDWLEGKVNAGILPAY